MNSAEPRNFKAAVETSNRLLGDAANGQLAMFEEVTRKGVLRDLAQQYVKHADGKPFKVESLEAALERRRKFDETKISMQKKREGKRISRAERVLRAVLEKAIGRKGVLGDWEDGQRILKDIGERSVKLSRGQKRAIETAPLNQKEGSPADISTADSAKIQKVSETTSEEKNISQSHSVISRKAKHFVRY